MFCLPMTSKWDKGRLDAFLNKNPKIETNIKYSLATWNYPDIEIGECDTFEIEVFDSYKEFAKAYKTPEFLFPPEAKWRVTDKFLCLIRKPLSKRFNETKRKLEAIDTAKDILVKMARNE